MDECFFVFLMFGLPLIALLLFFLHIALEIDKQTEKELQWQKDMDHHYSWNEEE